MRSRLSEPESCTESIPGKQAPYVAIARCESFRFRNFANRKFRQFRLDSHFLDVYTVYHILWSSPKTEIETFSSSPAATGRQRRRKQ